MLNDAENLDHLNNLITADWEKNPKDPAKTIHKKYSPSRRKSKDFSKWKIAASILLLVTLSIAFWTYQSPKEPFTTYSTGFSETLEVELPDGSRITLNANSKFHWDNQWKEKGTRKVMLEGEAFFDIKSFNNGMAF